MVAENEVYMSDVQLTQIVKTFMTHSMRDEEVSALATGRDEELGRVLDAIGRSISSAPGMLQHIVLYGARGYGKSFMTRLVQMNLRSMLKSEKKIIFLLLPEEQHNLQRSPHAFLDTISSGISNLNSQKDGVFEAALFQWPEKGDGQRLWEDSKRKLEAVLDKTFSSGDGLVVVVVENFDILLNTLFKDELAEQRLRLWLDRAKNRVMLFATATGTVDIDYDRPLFKAFESIQLSPWSQEECITYFNRLRTHEGRDSLNSSQEAKARAIADFIGGTPRLAQLLSEVLETQDALSVVETMSALADKLAEYYRRRIEDLSPLARGLLDALIRGGEPASQTELAKRVGASGQNTIARVMTDLQRADIIRGKPSSDSREKLYSVTDRVFVHYYRLRQGSKIAHNTPLETILEFLEGFYTQEERREQALRHLNAGQPNEASLFNEIAHMDLREMDERPYVDSFDKRYVVYQEAVSEVCEVETDELLRILQESPEDAYHHCRSSDLLNLKNKAFNYIVQAQALCRMGHVDEAFTKLTTAVAEVGDDDVASVIALTELGEYEYSINKKIKDATAIHLKLENRSVLEESTKLEAFRYRLVANALFNIHEWDMALEKVEQSINLSNNSKDQISLIRSYRLKGTFLGSIKRNEDAIEVFEEGLRLSRIINNNEVDTVVQMMCHQAFSYAELGRYDEALSIVEDSIKLAELEGENIPHFRSLWCKAYILNEADRHLEAIEFSKKYTEEYKDAGNPRLEASFFTHTGYAQLCLGKCEELADNSPKWIKVFDDFEMLGSKAEMLRHWSFALHDKEDYETALEKTYEAYDLSFENEDWHNLTWSVSVGLLSTPHIASAKIFDMFSFWISLWQKYNIAYTFRDPRAALGELYISAARSDSFDELNEIIEEHKEFIQSAPDLVGASQPYGSLLAKIADEKGRTEFLGILTTFLDSWMSLWCLFEHDYVSNWIYELVTGFGSNCKYSGILRDFGGVLKQKFPERSLYAVKVLNILAEIDEAERIEPIISRLDPDLVTLIRKLRNFA